MLIDNAWVVVVEPSDTCTVNDEVPLVEGVPEMRPEALSPSPAGSVPAARDHEYEPDPPLAAKVCEYAVPIVPDGNVVVVIFSGGAADAGIDIVDAMTVIAAKTAIKRCRVPISPRRVGSMRDSFTWTLILGPREIRRMPSNNWKDAQRNRAEARHSGLRRIRAAKKRAVPGD